MDYLFKTKLYCSLSEFTVKTTTDEMMNAYDDFVIQFSSLIQSENDFLEIFRMLSLTHVEFRALQALFLCEQEKKCDKKSVFTESDLVYRIRN